MLHRVNERHRKTVRKQKATFDPYRNEIVLCYETIVHQMPADFLTLQDELQSYSDGAVHVRVSQGRFASDVAADADMFCRCIKDCCVMHSPLILPYIAPASVLLDADTLRIALPAEDGPGIFEHLGLRKVLHDYMCDTYGMHVNVHVEPATTLSDDMYTAPDAVARLASTAPSATPKEAAFVSGIVSAAVSRRNTEFDSTPKRSRKVSGPLRSVCELVEGTSATIDVRVVSVDRRVTRSGELTIYTLCVTDYTGSVNALVFDREGRSSSAPVPKPDTWVRLSGKYECDSYSHSFVFRVSAIEPSQHVERLDQAAKKRVELHAHTKMSAMDAVTDVRQLIDRAASWGHEAIAITDHGVTQAFPAAATAAAAHGIKVIYGCEAYLYDDTTSPWNGDDDGQTDAEYVAFSLKTTGSSPFNAQIAEIGAVRIAGRQVVDTFQSYIAVDGQLSPSFSGQTGITDETLEDAPSEEDALRAFADFCGDTPLASYNIMSDVGFLNTKAAPYGIRFSSAVVDTRLLARLVFPELKNYALRPVLSHLGTMPEASGAQSDARAVGQVLCSCFDALETRGIHALRATQMLMDPKELCRSAKTYHIILLCRDKEGMTALNRLVSAAHIDYLVHKKPKFPRSEIEALREHLIIGSACESGELYQSVLAGVPKNWLNCIAKFYDYLEIQPVGNNRFMTRTGQLANDDAIREVNRAIAELGEELEIPVVATCDVHFLEPEDECFRRVLQGGMGYEKEEQPPLYFRTTEEMLEEFAYLGTERAYEIVVESTRAIASQVEQFELLPEETAMPVLEGAAEAVKSMAYETAHRIYGEPLPDIVSARLKRELDSIIGHGFSVLYYSAHKLVAKSNEDGYLVGSRGSVGSSLTATMTGITEVNPLPPHYVCPNCKHSDFDIDTEKYDCGVDLPNAYCPVCGSLYRKDGFNIPFEVFLGIDADKVPDIDLNFSGEYQNRAHKYTEELFGARHVFRAGTISGLKDKNVYGYVKHYADETGQEFPPAEVTRLQKGLRGVKKTTGQHPGGMVIVPRGHEIYEYTAVQWPANEPGADFVTTHFDFRSMHDVLIKLDILGHDAPTIMRLIQDITGLDPLDIPLADPDALQLFRSIEPLGISPHDLFEISKGTLGIPEFGTSFVRQMLEDTKPESVAEIIRICGLSHGTGVWLGNAQELIRGGACTLSEAICARDDIMNYLVARGVDKREAFFIMENTRKGKIARKGFSEKEAALMNDAQIPEWFVEACRKIEYLFPKGHAVAYCLMALRIAYCKVHYKEAFYATYFDVNTDKFDMTIIEDGLPGIRRRYEAICQKGNGATENERQTATLLEVCAEMYLRGLQFLRVDLEKSDPVRFVVERDGIRVPFVAVPQLGEKVARAIAEERSKAPFLSVEDLRRRTKLSSSVADAMQAAGAFAQLGGRDQMSIFDLR